MKKSPFLRRGNNFAITEQSRHTVVIESRKT